jgi:hypothetical protein
MFIAHAHEDKHLLEQLEKHLALLQRQQLIATWQDSDISAGTERAKQIDTHLESAQFILLLISADFLASDYCYSDEMTRALQRQESGDARVIPIILRPVDLRDAPFAKLLMLPKDGFPITKWRNRDEAFVNVVEGIRAAIEQWNQPFVFLAPQEKKEQAIAIQQTAQHAAELEQMYIVQLQVRANKALSFLSSLNNQLPLMPEEIWAPIAYLQGLELALSTDYDPLAQQLSALGLTQLSQKVNAIREDIHGALNVYFQMYQSAVSTRARTGSV